MSSNTLSERMQRHRAQPRTASTKPSRRDTKLVQAHVPLEVSRQLKQIALDEDTTQQQLVVEALNDLFRSRGLPPVA